MKKPSVYLIFGLLLPVLTLTTTGCGRKSGCHDIKSTAQPALKKDGTPKRKTQSHLFDKKTRRKRN